MKRRQPRLVPGLLVVPACLSLGIGWALSACSGTSASPSPAPSSSGAGGSVSQPDAAPPDADADAGDAGACPSDGGLPEDLACTGLYGDWSTRTIAAGVQAYTPGFQVWSDGANTQRWISFPPGSTIDTSDMDGWVFPDETKVWMQFSQGGVTLETRFLWKQEGAWTFADYRWSSDGSSATSLLTGEKNVGGTTYEIPSVNSCYGCHNGRTDAMLGFDVIGLGVSSAVGVTLKDLVTSGRLSDPPPATTIALPEDATGKAAPALGWLHVNCGVSCHNATPSAQAAGTDFYLKLLTKQLYPEGGTGQVVGQDAYATSVNVTANYLVNNDTPYLRIAPGDSAHSLVPLFALARDPDAGAFEPMPPTLSHVPDTTGVAALQAWIDALPK